jgi:hypothetical protein
MLAVALVAVAGGGSGVGAAHGMVALRNGAMVSTSSVEEDVMVASRALHAAGNHAAGEAGKGEAGKGEAGKGEAGKGEAGKGKDEAAKQAARDAKVAGLKSKIEKKQKALARKQAAAAKASTDAAQASAGGDAAKAEVKEKLEAKLKADVAAIETKLAKAEAKVKALLAKGKKVAAAALEPVAEQATEAEAANVAAGVPAMLEKIDAALDLGMGNEGVATLAGAMATDSVLSAAEKEECNKFLAAGSSWPAAVLNPGAAAAIDALRPALTGDTADKLEQCVSDNRVPQVTQVMVALKAGLDHGMPAELADTVLSQLGTGKVDAATARAVQAFTPAGQQLPLAAIDSSAGSPSSATAIVIGSVAAVVAVGAALVVYQRRTFAPQSSTNLQTYRDEYL